ncbi:DMT family transporter [uncultured Cohaesibacter sp.]|uniref:DMT family transporter n=1 Tax=uncultured Cohaesibacter sp. TaxID=1002546 RepID=UPI00292FB07A|nr:DMT family transporter [uncultured Cohaesibacter sp.]
MSPRVFAYLLFAVCPILLASNLIFGAVAVGTITPFTLAFLRWGLASLVILPFAWTSLVRHRKLFLQQWKLILLIAFLGMGICGSGVYMALRHSSATNGTLIYATPPLLIVVLEWAFRGRKISSREAIGIVLGLAGILFIVSKGHLETLLSIEFSFGDLLFVIAASSWAVYTVLSKNSVFNAVPTVGMFTIVGLTGAVIQIPFVIWENTQYVTITTHGSQWFSLAALVLFSSVGAFLAYQYLIRKLGPATAGLVMYLQPLAGVIMAVLFLDEAFRSFHLIGLILVMAGVLLATFPANLLKRGRTGSHAA